ncbi:glyoxylase-like metal-dependent hydrolase (beta-lactamase superfamily II) [Salirhabdus euzebyi]|uniref:Glyoxylase-like metal-dependent hydrolase (Beta-lactamase superfamily II) n=1 Tax=Salirhabdus euzebyi TaxID=394506 RepID=A0A841Q4A3_9BACI|nr:MBL fold metallo-hydrolase [Salirhabdus euzebyi]MBB6453160.1 glyoxylase-like metal-dependent hydrolase (beta-lactamase superfamily II) [Salirhabdus euzebyi]
MSVPTDLGKSISLIDLLDLGMKERTGSYVLHAEELTIVETSASPSIRHLLKGLEKLHIDPKDIKNIIVTHIHLDHAGGVGFLLEKCPNAKVIVHPRGKRHLANPTKLIQGARAVYGKMFDALFHPIFRVPEGRLITKEDGDTLKIGENRILTFYDTPGHANHHFSIHDSFSNGIFTGDTIGVIYPQTKINGFEFVLPSTSPNQFDPNAMLASLERIEKLGVEQIYFGHYGMSEKPKDVFNQIRFWLPKFLDTGKNILKEYPGGTYKEKADHIAKKLTQDVTTFLDEKGLTPDHEVYQYIKVDLQVCALGIVDYLAKH